MVVLGRPATSAVRRRHAEPREGKGVAHWPDGSVYDGQWKDDKMEGERRDSTAFPRQLLSFFLWRAS